MSLKSNKLPRNGNIFFTMDIDWATDKVIDYSLNFFRENNIKCTIFCTHRTDILKNLESDLFETAIHPNFNKSLIHGIGKKAKDIIEELLNIFPESKGIRSHSMTCSSELLYQFKNCGLIYDSNQFLPYNWSVKPYECFSGMKRIPYNWEDDVHFLYKKNFDYDINFKPNNLYVFDFHPVHIYLNTIDQSHYEKAKKFYSDSFLENFINKEKIGVYSFLQNLSSKIHQSEINTGFLKDLAT